MKISIVLLMCLSAQTSHPLYEKIYESFIKDIEKGNFISYNPLNPKNNITILADFCRSTAGFGKLTCTVKTFNDQNLGEFVLDTKNKPTEDIIIKMEEEIEKILIAPEHYSIVFLYSTCCQENHPIMLKFVYELKKANNERMANNSFFKILYKQICSVGNEKTNYFFQIYNDSSKSYFEKFQTNIFHYIDFFTQSYKIVLRIDIENICHVMEFCVDDFYHLVLPEIDIQKFYRYQIARKLFDIYNLYHHDIIFNYIKKYKKILCTLNYIFLNDDENSFELNIETEVIIFKIDDKEFHYFLEQYNVKESNNVYISTDCYRNIQIIISALAKTNIDNGIWCFYKLLLNNENLDFLVQRILLSSGSAINIIFSHLLLCKKTIDICTLHKLIKDKEYVETNILELSENITADLNKPISNDYLYLIALCLLLEIEAYINETDLIKNIFYILIKEIGIYILAEKNENEAEKDKTEHINLIEVFRLISDTHKEVYFRTRDIVLENICQIAMLFTGLYSFNIPDKYMNKYTKINQDDVITKIKLDKNNIKKNNENIRKRIKEKNIESTMKFEKIQFLKEIISKTNIEEKLNNLRLEIMERYIQTNRYESEKKIIENKGRIEITNAFNECESDLLRMNISTEIINEYRNIFIDKFILSLLNFTPENMGTYCKELLYPSIINLLKSEFFDDESEKVKRKRFFQNIKNLLNESEVFKIVNDNLKLFNEIMVELKKH
ncbi:uncharacterized protein VNE69_06001 [Vairimorpha necatrix]|uniref:Uncharacterized protein n=1 Tax=Vairimorpha necatrix TaxID=6039 RepID=A0AAX4JCQ3_9MICR